MGERMTVKEAAALLECSQETIRLGLIANVYKFGYAVKTSSKYTYVIMRNKFYEETGIERGDWIGGSNWQLKKLKADLH